MHILQVVIFGFIALGVFVLAAMLINKGGHAIDGAGLFIWVWLAASILNGAVGVFYAGIPVINELAAFIPIFGIPAGAAWYLSRRARSSSDSAT